MDRAKHAFGMFENVDTALSGGLIDAYDILFLKDVNDKPYVGWIDKEGNKVIVENKENVVRVDALPTENGDENVVYVYNNEGYIWDGTQCVSLSKSVDLSALEAKIDAKVDEATVDAKIETAVNDAVAVEVVEF